MYTAIDICTKKKKKSGYIVCICTNKNSHLSSPPFQSFTEQTSISIEYLFWPSPLWSSCTGKLYSNAIKEKYTLLKYTFRLQSSEAPKLGVQEPLPPFGGSASLSLTEMLSINVTLKVCCIIIFQTVLLMFCVTCSNSTHPKLSLGICLFKIPIFDIIGDLMLSFAKTKSQRSVTLTCRWVTLSACPTSTNLFLIFFFGFGLRENRHVWQFLPQLHKLLFSIIKGIQMHMNISVIRRQICSLFLD